MAATGELIGRNIGSYRILEVLGEGGMGVVYLAEHALIGRQAAIKVLHPELSRRSDVVHRFFNEARASALLKHPGIIEIYDFGNIEDGSAYIVMEFLEGQPLKDRLDEHGSLPVADAVAITHQLARALDAAHDKGIIHRDLKPDNVFIIPDPEAPGRERIKILDFGIAKLADPGGGMSRRTRTGAVLGTPLYMSPEQCEGAGKVDHRSDIYSMGVMLYEILTGRPPFIAEGFGQILAMHMNAAPRPPREIDPRIPQELEALVLKMLAKDREQRPPTALAVASEIEVVAASTKMFAATGGNTRPGSRFAMPVSTTDVTRADPVRPDADAPDEPPMPARDGDPVSLTASVTTLSAGAGVIQPASAPSRRGLFAALAVAVMLVGGGAGWWLVAGGSDISEEDEDRRRSGRDDDDDDGDDDDDDDGEGVGGLVVDGGIPADAALSGTAAPAGPIRFAISSEPSRARVLRLPERKLVGETPWSSLEEPVEGKTSYVLVLPGYEEATLEMDGAMGGSENVVLTRKRKAGGKPGKKPATAAPAAKTAVPATAGKKRDDPKPVGVDDDLKPVR